MVDLSINIWSATLGLKLFFFFFSKANVILLAGVDQEGIFRISGSARVVDKLKTSFNESGDADLDSDGEVDIMAVAGLLKLFLRELPDSLIPEHLTQEFIAIQTGEFWHLDVVQVVTVTLCMILSYCQASTSSRVFKWSVRWGGGEGGGERGESDWHFDGFLVLVQANNIDVIKAATVILALRWHLFFLNFFLE